MRLHRQHYTSIGITALISLWLASGFLESKIPEETERNPEPALTAVRAEIISWQDYTAHISIPGRTEAIRKVVLRSETDGQVVELPVEKGLRVKTGQVICRLAVDHRKAKLDEARALAAQRELEAKASRRLAERGHRSETQAAAAEAQLDAAKALVTQMRIELANTTIRAPFDGIVNARPAEIGSYLQKGDACATIVDDNPLLVVGNVSERDVADLAVGNNGTITMTNGEKTTGKVRFISAIANETTRTFRVELVVDNDDRHLRDGVTAIIDIPTGMIKAHLISPAYLVLNDDGLVGVRIVVDADIVQFHRVEIVGDGSRGMWITGLPDRVTLITVGHQFVRHGQKVRVDHQDRPS